jgi:esterase/lipase superfamily enzyme
VQAQENTDPTILFSALTRITTADASQLRTLINRVSSSPDYRGADVPLLLLAIADALAEKGDPAGASLACDRLVPKLHQSASPETSSPVLVLQKCAQFAERARNYNKEIALLRQAAAEAATERGAKDTSLRFVDREIATTLQRLALKNEAASYLQAADALTGQQSADEHILVTMGADEHEVAEHAKLNTHASFKVFYATQRMPTSSKTDDDPDSFFGRQYAPIQYGEVWVKAAFDRVMGPAARPALISLFLLPKAGNQVVLSAIRPYEDRGMFLKSLQDQLSTSERKEVMLYIHGFNNSFSEALRVTARLASDLEIDGAPILYSWPSRNDVLSYVADAGIADHEDIVAGLAGLLTDLRQNTRAIKINVVAHSMGSLLLLKALQRISNAESRQPSQRFDSIVFASPDVDSSDFVARVKIVGPLAHSVTLYASRRDRALGISKLLSHNPRAGDASPLVSLPGLLESVDTTESDHTLIGHNDFVEGVRDDIRAVIWNQLAADRRCELKPGTQAGTWVFSPLDPCGEAAFRYAMWFTRREGSVVKAVSEVDKMIPLLEFQAKQPGTNLQEIQRSLTTYQNVHAILVRLSAQ